MTRQSPLRRAPGLVLTALLAAVASGCGAASRDAVLACTTAAECGPAASCVQGSCQASTPPVTAFAPPTGLTTHRLVSISGTATDADAHDTIAGWSWTISRTSAACDATVDAGDGPLLQAVFWCAGTYEISLVATDSTGAQGAPARHAVTVTANAAAPVVTVGPPAAVEHRCGGTPLRCGLETPVGLSASAQVATAGTVTWKWTALPPDASRAGAAATLTPSDAAASPVLALATDGGPISGAWRLRVRATDANGNLGEAVQQVTVGNRPPTVLGTPLSLDHRYQAGRYLAEGPLEVTVTDPDGDPLEGSVALAEPAGTGCDAAFTPASATAGALSLSCPSAAGLAAAARGLRASASDVNGAATSLLVPVEVRNRLPVVLPAGGSGLTELALDHSVGACPGGTGRCFQVTGSNPFVVVDPDGDPVSAVTLLPGVEASRAQSVAEVGAGATFRFSTPVSRPAEFRDASGASGFWLTATASDPFGASAPAAPLAVRVLNRPPVVKVAAPAVSVGHRYDAATGRYLATAPLAVLEDPDGDPLSDLGGGGDESCSVAVVDGAASASCERRYLPSATSYPTLSGFAGVHLLVAQVSDGWAGVDAPTSLTITSTRPEVPAYDGAIEACACFCPGTSPDAPGTCRQDPYWIADPHHATFPVTPADADGDPLAVTFSSSASVTPASATAIPSACTATVDSLTFPVSVTVAVNDGVSQATATWTVRGVVCARQGQLCTSPTQFGRSTR